MVFWQSLIIVTLFTHLHPPANHLAGGEGRGFATGADLERVRDNYPSAEAHGPAKAHVRHVLSVGGIPTGWFLIYLVCLPWARRRRSVLRVVKRVIFFVLRILVPESTRFRESFDRNGSNRILSWLVWIGLHPGRVGLELGLTEHSSS